MSRAQLKSFKKMLLFPFILFLVALFTSTYKLILIVGDYVFTLALFNYFFMCGYGLFNAIVLMS